MLMDNFFFVDLHVCYSDLQRAFIAGLFSVFCLYFCSLVSLQTPLCHLPPLLHPSAYVIHITGS